MPTAPTSRWLIDLMLILSLLIVGFALYFTQISRLSTSNYHGDEGPWALAGDYYFRAYVLERDWSYERWSSARYGPWSGDTPVLGKYIIGAALWLLVRLAWRAEGESIPVRRLGASGALVAGLAIGVTLLLNPLLHQQTAANMARLVTFGRAVATYDVPAPFHLKRIEDRVATLVVTGLVETGTYFRLAEPTSWSCAIPFDCPPKPFILGRPFPDGWLAQRLWLDAIAALAGIIGVITFIVWPRAPLARRRNALMGLLWGGITAAGIVAAIPFAWERWYLPMEPIWATLQAIALVTPLVLLAHLGKRHAAGSQATE